MIDQMTDWVLAEEVLAILGLFSVALFFTTLIAIPALIIRLPKDYFLIERPSQFPNLKLLKNILGILLLLLGIVMLVLPGQGLLTLLVAIVLMDFPHKKKLEYWMIRRPTLLKSANWIRKKAGQPGFEI